MGRMWDLIVSVPDHCLSFYFLYLFLSNSLSSLIMSVSRISMLFCP